MKVFVDKDKCQGHARCYATAPGLFELDDEGYNARSEYDAPAGQESLARDAAAACPERAITVDE
jgi:ferredoxin